MPISNAEYLAMQARLTKSTGPVGTGCDDESELHNQILAYCRQKEWLAFHGSMAHKTYRTPGEPDFTIVTSRDVIFIECKKKNEKLSEDQLGIQAWLKKLGHELYVVRSYEEFLAIVKYS